MPGGQSEPIQHFGTQSLLLPRLFSIHPLADIPLDQGRVVVPPHIADDFDGHPLFCRGGARAFHHAAEGSQSHISNNSVAIADEGVWSSLEVSHRIVGGGGSIVAARGAVSSLMGAFALPPLAGMGPSALFPSPAPLVSGIGSGAVGAGRRATIVTRSAGGRRVSPPMVVVLISLSPLFVGFGR
jgi:hypothetical protein